MSRITIKKIAAATCFLLITVPGIAWSNRGHRMVNLVAAETLPSDMPAFMRTPQAIAEIAYLGPEPDRWRPVTAPELNKAAGPDHGFRYEAAEAVGPLPRQRYAYLRLLDTLRQQHPAEAAQLTPQFTGTLPWQAEEIYQRLLSAFIDYRIIQGGVPASQAADMLPMSKDDLPYVENAALYYAGWLGHYIADGSMPLHSSINESGWLENDNPHGYATTGAIHPHYESVTDHAIADGKITAKQIESYMRPAQIVPDSFAGTLHYLHTEGGYAEDVYKFDKQGVLQGSGTPALDEFTEKRMAEGGDMLRDLIYSAWIQSKETKAPALPMTVTLEPR